MNVLMLSPGFPWEMPLFTRGLARVGARVWGLAEQPVESLPEAAASSLSGYLQVDSLFDEPGVIAEARRLHDRVGLDRVECLWEPGMMLAARIREELGVPGMTVAETTPFRDKEVMKRVLDAAGLRTPRHAQATGEDSIREATQKIGYPLIVKPIAGAGSADTYRVDDKKHLEEILPRIRHVPTVSVEEYIEGEEYTFDTICADGEIAYWNMAWYRPKPLIARTVEWISAQTVTLRDPAERKAEAGQELGRAVIKALGYRTGFTHMEWFLTPSGEAVFGEIGARPPGARSVELMNYACDIDCFTGWAEATCHHTFSQKIERRYNSAIIFKRAEGQGIITEIEGLERLVARYRPNVVCIDLLPVGAPRRNWKQTLISDGYVIIRHPDLTAAMEIADRFGTDLQLRAASLG